MRNFIVLSALAILASAPARATDVHPTVSGSPQDTNNDGLGDGLASPPFEGLLRKVTASSIENRATQEFDVASFAAASIQSATLSGLVSVNNSLDTGLRTYDFLLYAGNGAVDVSDYQISATLAGSGSYHPPITSSFTYSFDVTSLVHSMIGSGATWIGLKVVCTSDPSATSILDDAMSTLAITTATTTGMPFCPGLNPVAPCPCGNDSPAGIHAGCLNSFGIGAVLTASGTASLTNDTIVLSGSSMTNSSALYFQGTIQMSGGAGTVFGDGLRCAGGSVTRLVTLVNTLGASQYPSGALPSVSVKGNITSPAMRTYQVWYRNAAPFCTPSTFNLTNGWELTWTP